MGKKPNHYFSLHIKILRLFGLWPKKESHSHGSAKELFYTAYQTIILFFFAYLFTITELIELYFTWGDFEKFIHNLCFSIVHVVACSKISLILLNIEDIQTITGIFERGVFGLHEGRCDKEAEIVKTCVNRTKKLLKIYFFIGTSVVLNGLLCPLYISADRNASYFENLRNSTVEVEKKLPYMSYFPFDVSATPNYEVAYLYQGVSLMTLSSIIVTTDIFYGSLLLHVATQFRILRGTLESLGTRALKNRTDGSKNHFLATKMYGALRKCVRHHYAIISLAEEMERIFNLLILLQFLSNLVIMCFPLLQITSVPIMSFPFFSNISLMSAMMYQLFIFCDCGDEVTQQSVLVAEAAYNSEWYDASLDFQRGIVLMIVRGQRPIELTVAKFAVLARVTYLKVVQGSASYFMFLQKMQLEE